MVKASGLAHYAEALLETEMLDLARERAEEAVSLAVSTGYRWVARPWHALARVAITTGDEPAAKSALNTLNDEIETTGAHAYRPLMHELRAQFARRFDTEWNADAELHAAYTAFAALGASGHIERLNGLN